MFVLPSVPRKWLTQMWKQANRLRIIGRRCWIPVRLPTYVRLYKRRSYIRENGSWFTTKLYIGQQYAHAFNRWRNSVRCDIAIETVSTYSQNHESSKRESSNHKDNYEVGQFSSVHLSRLRLVIDMPTLIYMFITFAWKHDSLWRHI